MAEDTTTTKPSRWASTVKKTRRIVRWIITLAIVFLITFVYWKYFYTYSEGYRAGLLQKFSNKGTFFKTYEGEMILSSVTSNSNVALASEKFEFSVTDKHLASKLDTLQGQNVIVHYIQKNGAVFWRGDSGYLVDSVKVRR
ncbi:MAG: hypothetical protein Q8868_11085 [Bacteroidota bacterium]|nr:hypothetical protein [Bacteroidota bacterium]